MHYCSTRGRQVFSFSEAILQGLAPDGGLLYPSFIPRFSAEELAALEALPYPEVAGCIMQKFAPDFPMASLMSATRAAYSPKQWGEMPVRTRQLSADTALLELFHGPTGAFKDFALQLLPHLMHHAQQELNARQPVVLVATSGDTGGATLAGFGAVQSGARVVCFFPRGGVSPLQRAQMCKQWGPGASSVEVEGDFDAAQHGVKTLFASEEFAKQLEQRGYQSASANSINIGRMLPQIVYPFVAIAQLRRAGQLGRAETIDICVPTGNFGNAFASFVARKMGAPIGRIIVASNANSAMANLAETGTLDIRQATKQTISPAMDIVRASNIERLLFRLAEKEVDRFGEWLKILQKDGIFTLPAEARAFFHKIFDGASATNAETEQEIRCCYAEHGVLVDPHTAVGLCALEKVRKNNPEARRRKAMVYSTAHYGKFAGTVLAALNGHRENSELQALRLLERTHAPPSTPPDFFDLLRADRANPPTAAATPEAMGKAVLAALDGDL